MRLVHNSGTDRVIDLMRPHLLPGLLVAVRKRAFLAAASCNRSGNEIGPVVHPIPSSSNGNAGLSTVATDAPHRQGRSLRWITRAQHMVSRRGNALPWVKSLP